MILIGRVMLIGKKQMIIMHGSILIGLGWRGFSNKIYYFLQSKYSA